MRVEQTYILKNSFPLLDRMVDNETYSFMNVYNGYNQVRITRENKLKTIFITS